MCAEIFSPSRGYLDVMKKVSAHLEAGVKSVWVIVPPLRTITIYHPPQPPNIFAEGRAADSATGLEVDVAAIFSDRRARPESPVSLRKFPVVTPPVIH
jgi:Uma2 family endonuclease